MDFNNWKDWEDDSDEDLSSFDKFSEVSVLNMHSLLIVWLCSAKLTCWFVSCTFLQMMNSMGGDDLPDLDGADEEV